MNNTINKGLTMNDTTLTMVQNTSQGGRGGVRGAEGGAAVRYITVPDATHDTHTDATNDTHAREEMRC